MAQNLIRRSIVTLSLSVITLSMNAVAGDPVFVGQQVTKALPYDKVDHSVWDNLLTTYVDKDGYVDYTKWHSSAADQQRLLQYLTSLSHANPGERASKDAKLAFWINAYNALTIHGILREYPTTSIRNHTARFFGYNIWHDLQLYVGGKSYSLDAMEHKILRKADDPRIHFAIVCASVGCPRLMNAAFTRETVQAQLEANAKDFFRRPQNFRFDSRSQTFYVSSILSWFGEDFGANPKSRLQRIARWLPQSAQSTARRGHGSLSFLEYNWNLNDQKGRRSIRK